MSNNSTRRPNTRTGQKSGKNKNSNPNRKGNQGVENSFSHVRRLVQQASYGNVLCLSKNIFAADSLCVPLRYILPYQSISNVGNSLASIRLTSNAYDVDSALGSTSMAGFTEYAAIYSRFRTLAMSYTFSFANQETFPVSVFSGFMTTSLSSGSVGANYCENPYMHALRVIGPLTGNGITTQKGSVDIPRLFGASGALEDDLYTGSTTSSTLSSTGTAHLYAATACNVGTASGVICQGEVTLFIQFYRRNALIS